MSDVELRRRCRLAGGLSARPPCWRMCGAMGRDVEIAGELGHFTHEPDKSVLPTAGKSGFALLLGWSANLVAAREAVDLGAVFGQSCQKMRQIFQPFSDDMDDTAFLLHKTGDRHVTCT